MSELPGNVYEQVLPQLEQAATTSLQQKIDGVDGYIRTLRADYEKYSSEGTLKKLWEQRPFDLPPPTLLNDAAEAARLARDWLSKKDFNMARHHLKTANERATRVEVYIISLLSRFQKSFRGRVRVMKTHRWQPHRLSLSPNPRIREAAEFLWLEAGKAHFPAAVMAACQDRLVMSTSQARES